MIAKRPTQKLKDLGFESLEVIKGLYGFYLRDTTMKYQRSTTYKTGQEVVDSAIRGEKPTDLSKAT